ncbi:MAG: hypothetical protein NT066_07540, partial [Candidatus Omnitrophica bacterium]|nr:hypothetical protein [Candidatus Omnitrophota bacterium]
MKLSLPNKGLFRKEKIKAGGEIIAIDTCDSSLKIIRGGIEKGKIIVSGFAYKKVFSHDKEYSFLADKVKELLKECGLEPQKLKRSRIYAVIPGSEVCVRVLKLPAMPDDEIKQAVRAKIKEVVSYPL